MFPWTSAPIRNRRASVIARFAKSSRGAVAPIMGLSLLAVVGAVGMAIDYGRVYGVQLRLQTALDAATLATARKAKLGGDDLEGTFQSFLTASNPIRGELTLVNANVEVTDRRVIVGTMAAALPMMFMPVIGIENIEINVRSSASYTIEKTEVALVLDNTGSMAGAKLEALKDASVRLIETLTQNLPEPDVMRFSLVPFAQYVNVGQANRNASWMSVPSDGSTTTHQCWDTYPNAVKSNCRMQTFTAYNDGSPYTYEAEVCDWNWGTAVQQCGDVTQTVVWNGCAGSRNYPLNVKDSDYSTPIPGIMNVSCPSQIMPLTEDTSAVKSAIRSMVATGTTYIPSGLIWGLRALSTQAPFDESAGTKRTANGEPLRKFLILMTDGENTSSPTYPDHTGNDKSSADSLTRETCAKIKASEIEIFTVAFEVTDTSTKDLLRSCATPSGGFFDASNSGQLDAAFQAIAQQMTLLRLTN